MTIARFTPINDVVSLREAMDRLFEDSFIRPNGSWSGLAAGQVAVPVDLWETKDAYHLRADLPGMTPEDVQEGSGVNERTGRSRPETPTRNSYDQ